MNSRVSPRVEDGAEAETVAIVLIEDNPADARLICGQLREVAHTRFTVRHVGALSSGLIELEKAAPDIILLDLSLPDSTGLDTVARVRICAPDVPLVVLSGTEDERIAVAAVMAGAQDYLVKGQLNGQQLARTMRSIVERVKRQRQQQALAMEDDLTGLHSRLSFDILARQALKTVRRTGAALHLLLMDLSVLRQRGDESWRAFGDQAMLETANLLRATFRESDILARLGEDEFAVLVAMKPQDSPALLVARVNQNLAAYNADTNHRRQLSFGVGMASYDPAKPCTVEELLAAASRSLFRDLQRQLKE